MKALTLHPEHAEAFRLGLRTVESRTQRTHHRGLVLLHAGARDECSAAAQRSPVSRRAMDAIPHGDPLTRRAIVAVAEIVDCVPSDPYQWTSSTGGPHTGHVRGGGLPTELWWSDGERRITYRWDEEAKLADFVNNRWAWLLANVRPLPEPVPCRGAQGLWNAPGTVAAAVLAQLSEVVRA